MTEQTKKTNLSPERDSNGRFIKGAKIRLGKKMSQESRKRISLGHLGQKAWNRGIPMTEEKKQALSLARTLKLTGRKYSQEHREKISKALSGGVMIGYVALHEWVTRELGRPTKCTNLFCEDKSKTFEWANKSHTYKKELEDWLSLCRKCHRNYDKDYIGLKEKYFTKNGRRILYE